MNKNVKRKLKKGLKFHTCPHCGAVSNGRNKTYESKDGKLHCDCCHNVLDKRVYR